MKHSSTYHFRNRKHMLSSRVYWLFTLSEYACSNNDSKYNRCKSIGISSKFLSSSHLLSFSVNVPLETNLTLRTVSKKRVSAIIVNLLSVIIIVKVHSHQAKTKAKNFFAVLKEFFVLFRYSFDLVRFRSMWTEPYVLYILLIKTLSMKTESCLK